MKKIAVWMCLLSLHLTWLWSQESNQAELVSLSNYTHDGHKKWDILAESAEIFPGEDSINLKLPKGSLYEEGSLKMNLEAESGVYNPKTGEVYLKENVQLENISGDKVKTSDLFWDAKQETLEMKNDIEMVKDNVMITGRGMKVYKVSKKTTLQKKC